jgi:hypothetical protein
VEKSTHILKDREARRAVALLIDSLPLGTKVEIGEESRTARQNRAIHGLIGQIMKQRPQHHGVKLSLAAYKAIFMAGLGEEAEWVPNLDGTGMVPVGLSTSSLTVRQFNDLMEFVFAWCAREGVVVKHFDDGREAARGQPGHRAA